VRALHLLAHGTDEPRVALSLQGEDDQKIGRVQRGVQLAVHHRAAHLHIGDVEEMVVGPTAPGTVLESNELGAALDRDAERGQPIDQEMFVRVLRIDQRVRIRAQPLSHVAEGGAADLSSRHPEIDGDGLAPGIDHHVREADLTVELERACLHGQRA
jgi:hypothetical protein